MIMKKRVLRFILCLFCISAKAGDGSTALVPFSAVQPGFADRGASVLQKIADNQCCVKCKKTCCDCIIGCFQNITDHYAQRPIEQGVIYTILGLTMLSAALGAHPLISIDFGCSAIYKLLGDMCRQNKKNCSGIYFYGLSFVYVYMACCGAAIDFNQECSLPPAK